MIIKSRQTRRENLNGWGQRNVTVSCSHEAQDQARANPRELSSSTSLDSFSRLLWKAYTKYLVRQEGTPLKKTLWRNRSRGAGLNACCHSHKQKDRKSAAKGVLRGSRITRGHQLIPL
ncbi:hypothetical protein AGOR_G00209970 [Albula goreensis]|uniref:Uncharacterized protein n=1 Tax=Albula goreensis TaxID=1534307 RepID=A0A8T3CLS9_9TELE|nr:hypothetical protein AGOR_G00209970 [Albula goreensis]